MTRTSNNKWAATVSCLLSLAAAGAAVAQDNGGERYARALADAAITQRYNVQIEPQLRSQEQEIASLEQQIMNLDATAVDVQGMLTRMYDDLVQFVTNDVPFFKEEREQRLQRLADLMQNVEASPSEKFRRLLEAYQIEMEYGRQMTAYKQTLDDGREAEMVRLGRVALMYRVTEGGETGYWDHEAKQFVADPDAAGAIQEALSIAKEERAPDLIVVPVPAPQGGRS